MEQLFRKLLVMALLIPITIFGLHGQDVYMLQGIKQNLSKPDLKKIEKAEKYLASGNQLMEEAISMESSGKSSNKAYNKKISASSDLGSAHKIIYDVYTDNIEKLSKIASADLVNKAKKDIDAVNKQMKEARKKRESSLKTNVPKSASELLVQACEIEKKALGSLAATFIALSGRNITTTTNINNATENTKKTSVNNTNKNTEIEEIETNPVDDKKNLNDNKKQNNTEVEEVETPDANDIDEVKQSEVPVWNKEQDGKGVFFKIQFAASKTPLTVEQLNSIYKTNELFNVEKDGEWYKYSISKKFADYNEANNYKNNLKVKGIFVIAYKNGKRVTVEEALKKDDITSEVVENKKVEPEKENTTQTGKTIYRIQIGISTSKLTDQEITMFKSGGKPVLTIDHGGWFSYNVGEFNTEQEAQKFKKEKGLVDASVVKFIDGKLIEN